MSDQPETPEARDELTELSEPDVFEMLGDHPVYIVCDAKVEAGGFTVRERMGWRTFEREKAFADLEAKISKAGTAYIKDIKESERYTTQEKLIASLEKGRDKRLVKLENDPLAWTDDDADFLERVSEQLEAARAKLEELDRDPEAVAETSRKALDVLEELRSKRSMLVLEFVHKLATDRKSTTAKLTAWKEQATGQDLINAVAVVQLGNVGHNSGGRAKRHFEPKLKSSLN